MIRNKSKILFFFLLMATSAFGQIENLKWKKAEPSYENNNNFRHREYSFNFNAPGDFLIKTIAYTYWFFISDVDGDNCPFRPSCSAFLVQSIEQTDIAQGTLMFFDRFTRDMNLYKDYHRYPRVTRGYYYDPPSNYTLNKGKIKYLPSAYIIEE